MSLSAIPLMEANVLEAKFEVGLCQRLVKTEREDKDDEEDRQKDKKVRQTGDKKDIQRRDNKDIRQ